MTRHFSLHDGEFHVRSNPTAPAATIVAAIQTGIAAGAAAGGTIVDTHGVSAVFATGSAVLLAATLPGLIATSATAATAEKASLADTYSQLLSTSQESIRETH